MQEKLNKSASEKAKAENKYFATMRIKDQLEQEKKAVSRTLEKQSKTLERYAETEGSLKTQLANQARDISQHEGTILECRHNVSQLETGVKRVQYHKDGLEARLAELTRTMSAKESEQRQTLNSKRKVEEQLSLCKSELERLKSRANNTTTKGDKETNSKLENCMKLLLCSTCKEHFRTRLLSKCFHSECPLAYATTQV